jgi:hypothetical protein
MVLVELTKMIDETLLWDVEQVEEDADGMLADRARVVSRRAGRCTGFARCTGERLTHGRTGRRSSSGAAARPRQIGRAHV